MTGPAFRAMPLGVRLIVLFYVFGAVMLLVALAVDAASVGATIATAHGLSPNVGTGLVPVIAVLALVMAYGLYAGSHWGFFLAVGYLLYLVVMNLARGGLSLSRTGEPLSPLVFGNLLWAGLILGYLLVIRRHFWPPGKVSTRFTRKAGPVWLMLTVALGLVSGLVGAAPLRGQQRVSEFGRYQGYATAAYDGYERTSDYLATSDGTQLAYDLFLPTQAGQVATEPLPALFQYTAYGRAWTVFDRDDKFTLTGLGMPWYMEPLARVRSWLTPNGKVMDALALTEWLQRMVKHGYAVIVIERPGTGASFGEFSHDPEVAAREADELLNWIAAQPWCDGNIGMFGDSFQAQIQFQAASTGNPHLKAIFPATTWMDQYSALMYPGGILNKAFANLYRQLNLAFNGSMITPVDDDVDGTVLAQIQAERFTKAALAAAVDSTERLPYRDSTWTDGDAHWVEYYTLYPLLERINASGVPAYMINGWYDVYARDNFLIYANLTVPKRLLVRPADHNGIEAPGADVDIAAEAHRWFDTWLKGVDNGILNEPPIHYYLQNAHSSATWKVAEVWPPDMAAASRYYLAPGGTLQAERPVAPQAPDRYTVDFSTTTGTRTRWAALAAGHKYPDLRGNDAKARAYTTSPLATAISVVGHPIVHVWLSTEAPDLDVFAYLEAVDGNGRSTYITEGCLRASHRALGSAPFDNFGLPWHNHFQSDVQPLSVGVPVELVFDLLPTAYQFLPGQRLRVTVAFADADNLDTPRINPPPTLQLWGDVQHPSFVDLPLLYER